MKCTIPEISWHNRDPVLAIDIQPNPPDGIYRLATAGTDTHIVVRWRLWLLLWCKREGCVVLVWVNGFVCFLFVVLEYIYIETLSQSEEKLHLLIHLILWAGKN